MHTRRMNDDGPGLGLVVGDRLDVGAVTLERRPPRSAATIVDGAIVLDTPGYFTFRRANGASYFQAVAFDERALAMVPGNGASGGRPRDPRAALRGLAVDPRLTEQLISRTIEAEPTTDRPGTGEPGALLPFDSF